mmetsp:Transcript_10422/g.21424  ORF Transcript_10422/g.21424 Transcript_10422/m.21424 type:complete len:261 (+) Transcript_10422:225-1007(+)
MDLLPGVDQAPWSNETSHQRTSLYRLQTDMTMHRTRLTMGNSHLPTRTQACITIPMDHPQRFTTLLLLVLECPPSTCMVATTTTLSLVRTVLPLTGLVIQATPEDLLLLCPMLLHTLCPLTIPTTVGMESTHPPCQLPHTLLWSLLPTLTPLIPVTTENQVQGPARQVPWALMTWLKMIATTRTRKRPWRHPAGKAKPAVPLLSRSAVRPWASGAKRKTNVSASQSRNSGERIGKRLRVASRDDPMSNASIVGKRFCDQD